MTELLRLPPVLSLQLVRYEYDYATMEKKKIKAAVSLPPTLHMGPRLGWVKFYLHFLRTGDFDTLFSGLMLMCVCVSNGWVWVWVCGVSWCPFQC